MKKIAIVFLLSMSFSLIKAQVGVAINTAGNSNLTGAILDLSNNNTNGAFGFMPPYVLLTSVTILDPPITGGTASQLSGLFVYNTNPAIVNGLSGQGLYYWNNTLSSWVYFAGATASGNGTTNYLARWITSTVLGTGVTQDNGSGVSISATTLTPMNMLDVNGGVAVGAYAGTLAAPSGVLIISGQMGIGNSTPNADAILDLTNASNKGLMLPAMSTANLPSAPPNGLVVFNTTLECPEYYSNGTWYRMFFVQ